VLDAVVDSVAVTERDGATWVALRKELRTLEETV
jgi:hypothetical protein